MQDDCSLQEQWPHWSEVAEGWRIPPLNWTGTHAGEGRVEAAPVEAVLETSCCPWMANEPALMSWCQTHVVTQRFEARRRWSWWRWSPCHSWRVPVLRQFGCCPDRARQECPAPWLIHCPLPLTVCSSPAVTGLLPPPPPPPPLAGEFERAALARIQSPPLPGSACAVPAHCPTHWPVSPGMRHPRRPANRAASASFEGPKPALENTVVTVGRTDDVAVARAPHRRTESLPLMVHCEEGRNPEDLLLPTRSSDWSLLARRVMSPERNCEWRVTTNGDCAAQTRYQPLNWSGTTFGDLSEGQRDANDHLHAACKTCSRSAPAQALLRH